MQGFWIVGDGVPGKHRDGEARIMTGKGMRTRARRAVAAALVVLGALAVAAPAALAGAGLSATPRLDDTIVQVGQTTRGGTLTLQNANNGGDVGGSVCRADDPAGGPLPDCAGAEGIVFTPSCGPPVPSG